jgi:hypothetical protein
MFQYDGGIPYPPQEPIIKDFGRTESAIADYFQDNNRKLSFSWSLDGVRVAVDEEDAPKVPAMVTVGDARTDNTIQVVRAREFQVNAWKFNSLRNSGFFDWPRGRTAVEQWKITKPQKDQIDNAAVHVAVLSVPTHSLKVWGEVLPAERLNIMYEALDIAFDSWARDYRSDSVYVFAAPEYYFGGAKSHFLEDQDATSVTDDLKRRLQLLPNNYVIIPGSVGRRRMFGGKSAYAYYQNHVKQQLALIEEMKRNRLAKNEIGAQQFLWDYEPKLKDNNEREVPVFSNTALVFCGDAQPFLYIKRYESDPDGKAPDREAKENKDGFFEIGTERFQRIVKNLTVRLEICADNAYRSIKEVGYDGLHVVLGSNFGRGDPTDIHGQLYVCADSNLAFLSMQQEKTVASKEEEARERNMFVPPVLQKASRSAEKAECILKLYKVNHPAS